MKKIVAISIAASVALNTGLYAADEDLAKEVAKLQKDLKRLKKQVIAVKKHDGGDNIKFGVDFRSTYDGINYKTESGEDPENEVLSNRLILTMAQQPTDNLIFKGEIVANKLFGHNNYTASNGFNNYDWFGTVTPDDGVLRVREANFVYFGNMTDSVGTTFSIGRRPSLDGNPGYLREGNEKPNSPTSHNINMEFDGFSLGFRLGAVTGVEGMNFKICGGRGYSNAYGKYNYYTDFSDDNASDGYVFGTPTDKKPYAHNKSDTPNMDMLGFIWKVYDDAQYKVSFNYAKAVNLLGINSTSNFNSGFKDVGDMTTAALTFEANGIGDEINDFLDDAKVFASYAQSTTDPKTGESMLGSAKSKTGSSMWAGVEWACQLVDDARIGVEYNTGSRYWRSFTYGEDTLIGSKLAARGSAIELYFDKKLVGDYLTMQLRHTQINYDYTGSDMFFGDTGTPVKTADAYATGMMGDPVKSATDTRVSLRYRY